MTAILISSGEDYCKRFDPKEHLRYYQDVTEWSAQPLRELHTLYRSYDGTVPIKVLNYGAGAVLMYDISAAAVAAEIVLAEYAKQNREALQQWLDRDPNAHDWSIFFKYVIRDLEGNSDGEQEASAVEQRQEQLRRIAKVVTCDIFQDLPIQSGYEGPYDVVHSSLCLDSVCTSPENFIEGVSKLVQLLKPGGRIALNSASGDAPTNFYLVGQEKFIALSTTPELLTTALGKAGCRDITIKRQPRDTPGVNIPEETCDFSAMLFTTAVKNY